MSIIFHKSIVYRMGAYSSLKASLIFWFQLICRCISPSSNSNILDNAKLSDREVEEQRRAESVRIAIDYINQEFSPMFRDMKPTEQTKVDAIIS